MASSVQRCATAGIAALLTLVTADGQAQTVLTLAETMARARTATPAARALGAAADASSERVREARSGYFPRVDVIESAQRGNHPVFVFGGLLAQHRFSAANFAIDTLNRPAPLTNVRTAVAINQAVFDAGATRLAVERAALERDAVGAARDSAAQDLALAAATAFVRVLQLEAAARANAAAVASAESDLERARERLAAGVVTSADHLQAEVHLADVRQRRLAADAELSVARVQLNEAVGLPLGESTTIEMPPRPAPASALDALIRDALERRADRREANVRVSLAANARRAARAAYLPVIAAQGGVEFNGGGFTSQQSSWAAGVELRFNVFSGFGDAARAARARHEEAQVRAERDRLERAIEVEVRAAAARLEAARARDAVGAAAVLQARESQRIIRDRYESGLATMGDVLRAAAAVLDAEARAIAAYADVVLQSVALERAAGRL